MFYQFDPYSIIGVDVFFEKHKTRLFVGRLTRKDNLYRFDYDIAYLKTKNVIPLGVEFPLIKEHFESLHLFESFKDRLPDPDNPAYFDYCRMAGIDSNITDPLILLPTIAKRGPSSFIFEPHFDFNFTFEICEQWRKDLNFSINDFSLFFDISVSIIQKIKSNKSTGREVLERLNLYWIFKDVFLYQLQKNGKYLHHQKLLSVHAWMKKRFG